MEDDDIENVETASNLLLCLICKEKVHFPAAEDTTLPVKATQSEVTAAKSGRFGKPLIVLAALPGDPTFSLKSAGEKLEIAAVLINRTGSSDRYFRH